MKDVRQNKGSILRATVEYVKVLKEDQARHRQLEEKLKFQEFQHRKLLRILQVGTCHHYCHLPSVSPTDRHQQAHTFHILINPINMEWNTTAVIKHENLELQL